MPTYVRQSAKLSCSMGSARSAMQLSHPADPVLICGAPMAGGADNMTFANIVPFGLCKSPMNPTVIAATAAAGGKLQEMPCVPNMRVPWLNAKSDVLVKGRPALTDGSRCVCMWAGIIEVKSAGQESVISAAAPPPLMVVERQTQAAVAEAVKEAKAAPQTPQGDGGAQTTKKGPMAAIATAVKTAVENAVNTVKERVTAIISAVVTAASGYVSAIIATMSAAVMAVVGGIFGLRGKGGEAEVVAEEEEAEESVETPEECFCNKEINVDEFQEIVRCLRKADGRRDIALFIKKNCKIPSEDKTMERLTEEFNNTCREYGIVRCIQKIHFLSQIYWESDHFNTALEYKNGEAYNPDQRTDARQMGNTEEGDGPKYKGRGLMQLTWRNSQLAYLKHARDKFEKLKGLTDADIEKRENCFEKLISDTLFGSMDSAGWFWSKYKTIQINGLNSALNEVALFADKYQERISIAVNGGKKGKNERKKYYDALKTIMKADQCLNPAKADSGQATQNAEGTDKAKQNAAPTAKDKQSPNQAKAADGQAAQKTGGTGEAKQNAAPIAKTEVTARLTRDYFGRRLTLGKFTLFHKGKQIFECDACEDVVRGKGYGPNADAVKKWKIPAETAIPYGSYTCLYTYDPKIDPKEQSIHAERRLVNEVPGYRGIRIHRGKSQDWTEGCILLGTRKKDLTGLEDSTENTIAAFERHLEESCGKKPFVLEITDDKKPGVTNDEFLAELNKASNAKPTNSGKCFCGDNKFKPDDLRRIIKGLRDLEKEVSGSLFCMDNCDIPRDEKTIERLTTEINNTCNTYGINKCIQKIHFLSQIYHESDRFRTTVGNKELEDGSKYKGRGLIQLIGRELQLTYLKSVKNENEVLKSIRNVIKSQKLSASIWEANKEIVDKNKKDTSDAAVNPKVDAIIDKPGNNYETIISDSLATALDSAGWYWSRWKNISSNIDDICGKPLNEAALFADKYQEIITKTINDGNDAKIKRKLYYDALKKIMNVNQCTSKSTYKGGLS